MFVEDRLRNFYLKKLFYGRVCMSVVGWLIIIDWDFKINELVIL